VLIEAARPRRVALDAERDQRAASMPTYAMLPSIATGMEVPISASRRAIFQLLIFDVFSDANVPPRIKSEGMLR